jgi:hypothetical protein
MENAALLALSLQTDEPLAETRRVDLSGLEFLSDLTPLAGASALEEVHFKLSETGHLGPA